MLDQRIPTARDCMETNLPTLSPQDDLLEAIQELAENRVAAAAVVSSDNRLLGMLTEKDCLRILSVTAFHHPHGGQVADFMSVVSHAVTPDMDIFRIAEIFLEGNFPTLPVLEGERLVGCVSRQHILNGIMELSQDSKGEEQVRIEASAAAESRRPRSIQQLQATFARYTRDQMVNLLGRKR